MTWSSIKDVVAVLTALVGLISAVATGAAKIWSWCKALKAPVQEPAVTATSPVWAGPEPAAALPLVSDARPHVEVIPAVSALAREQALAAVKAPAIAMLVLAATGLLLNVVLAGFTFVDNFVTPLSSSSLLTASPPDHKPATDGNATSDQANIVLTIMLFLSMATAALAAFFGGLNMLKLKHRLVAVAGSVAIMPGTCFCCLLGFPIGVWSMMVLLRPEVKAAFHS
jgi:hypothetical protein